MADAVIPRWHGDNYQARVFWLNALSLLDSTSLVVEVTFEANGPKAFDDVVVKYDPPAPSPGRERIAAAYHQVKWHVTAAGRFGYESLIDPAFIGAKTVSILERLRDAKATAPSNASFAFITTDRIADGDQLAALVSNNDKSLLVEKLFDGTTDASRMGKVRKLWREHLHLTSDDELKSVVSGLRIFEGYKSLEELRQEINIRAQVVGALVCTSNSDFRYDELARALKVRGLHAVTRETLTQVLREEGLLNDTMPEEDPALPVAIRSFVGIAADLVGASPDDTLLLTDEFNQRYLRDDRDWQEDIGPRVRAFLGSATKRSSRLKLILDAHQSIAFLSGAVLDLKSGVDVSLVQKGRVGTRTWRADDGTQKSAPALTSAISSAGDGSEIAVAVGISQAVEPYARAYVAKSLPSVGRLLNFAFPEGAGQQNVAGGGHAALLAEQIANEVRAAKAGDPDATVHLFCACPNSLLFFLGQQHRGFAPCIVYEFDFDRQGNKTYQPSFVIA